MHLKTISDLRVMLLLLPLGGAFGTAANAVTPSSEVSPSELRVTTAADRFSGTVQATSVFHFAPPRWLDTSRFELGIGAISNDEDTRAFMSLGPVWRFEPSHRSFYTELGFSPTLLGGSSFGESDMGGNVHFTSSVSAGRRFKSMDNSSLVLRVQHISNGGLNSENPGMDMIGLSFTNSF